MIQNTSSLSKTKNRKPYSKPSYTQLLTEQAKSFLLERANQGHPAAQEMLTLMFSHAVDPKDIATKSAAQR